MNSLYHPRARFLLKATLASAAMVLWSSAWAAKDFIYPSAADGGTGNSFSVGAPGNVSLGAVAPGATVSVTVTWSIENRRGTGANTGYPRMIGFDAVPLSIVDGINQAATVSSGASCNVASSADTCSTTIRFTAPSPASGTSTFMARVRPLDTDTGNAAIEGPDKYVNINFSVTAASIASSPTVTEAHGPYCTYLNGTPNLQATLTTAGASPAGIPGQLISFALESAPTSETFLPFGSAMTAYPTGVAALSGMPLGGRGVGDYTVRATFAGDSSFAGSADTATVGIGYAFLGFQPPINPAGTSIFSSGRTIPIKIRIADALNNPVTNASPTVWMKKLISGETYGDETEVTSVSAADSGNQMRYSAAEDQYMYNWDTSALSNGVYVIRVDLGSATCGSPAVTIRVNKKK